MVEVAMLGSEGIYIGLDEGKAEGVGQSNSQHGHFSPEDGVSMFLRNVGIYRRAYTAPKPKRTTSSSS
jgi:hypothetical protein